MVQGYRLTSSGGSGTIVTPVIQFIRVVACSRYAWSRRSRQTNRGPDPTMEVHTRMSQTSTDIRMASLTESFQRDGFVVVPSLFDSKEIREISAWTDEIQAQPETPARAMMYFEPSLLRPGERVLQRVENFCPFHPGFAALCHGHELRR